MCRPPSRGTFVDTRRAHKRVALLQKRNERSLWRIVDGGTCVSLCLLLIVTEPSFLFCLYKGHLLNRNSVGKRKVIPTLKLTVNTAWLMWHGNDRKKKWLLPFSLLPPCCIYIYIKETSFSFISLHYNGTYAQAILRSASSFLYKLLYCLLCSQYLQRNSLLEKRSSRPVYRKKKHAFSGHTGEVYYLYILCQIA